jgi:hypothetical protein
VAPYLSLVIASRNDNYIRTALRRLQITVSSLLEQVERHQLRAELILVEWNPPRGRPRLREALAWPRKTASVTIRIIEVPYEIHELCLFADRLPFLVHRARNVGIRRARGKFIVPIGTDLMLSDALVQFIAAEQLDPGTMYRVDRHDVSEKVMEQASLDERLAYAERNVLRIFGREGFGPTSTEGDGVPLQTNACGDFTLLSRELWLRLQGIPEEQEFHSLYFDGVLCHAAFRAGAREEVLRGPMRIYRIDRESTWADQDHPVVRAIARTPLPHWLSAKILRHLRGAMPPTGSIKRAGVPIIEYASYQRMVADIAAGLRPFVCNDSSWGLGEYELLETVISRGEWDRDDAEKEITVNRVEGHVDSDTNRHPGSHSA